MYCHPAARFANYGSEKVYNALRLAMALQKEPEKIEVRVFPMADVVSGAVAKQSTPQGYYNVERTLDWTSTRTPLLAE